MTNKRILFIDIPLLTIATYKDIDKGKDTNSNYYMLEK